jgi:hypothetical protein|tara:strand:+ start:1074 stop:1733 length:660 start_codon:yes stop_codon:yes gene_type:complete
MSSIWVYGDSWVYGAGEPGWKDTLDKYTNGHHNSWANQLEDISGKKIINRGIPSNNNLNIAGNILQDSVNFSKKDIIIVMWSCPSRFSVMFGELRESVPDGSFFLYKTCNITTGIIPHKTYTNSNMDINTAIAMSSTLSILKDFNFIFTSGFTNFTIENCFLIVDKLINENSNKWCYRQGFQKVLHTQKLIRDCGHPNTKGHQLIAHLVYKELIKRNFI